MKDIARVFAQQDNERVIIDILHDLFTGSELMTIRHRVEVAKCLKKGMKYKDIIKATGASSTTIARVSERVKYGSRGYDYF